MEEWESDDDHHFSWEDCLTWVWLGVDLPLSDPGLAATFRAPCSCWRRSDWWWASAPGVNQGISSSGNLDLEGFLQILPGRWEDTPVIHQQMHQKTSVVGPSSRNTPIFKRSTLEKWIVISELLSNPIPTWTVEHSPWPCSWWWRRKHPWASSCRSCTCSPHHPGPALQWSKISRFDRNFLWEHWWTQGTWMTRLTRMIRMARTTN